MNISINILWVILGCIFIGSALTTAVFVGLWYGNKTGSESKDEVLTIVKQEMADQRETVIDSCIGVMEELYKDQDGKCINNCIGRKTGSQAIDEKMERLAVKHGNKVKQERIQEAKENPDLCSKCHRAETCAQPEEPVEECRDFTDSPLPEGEPDPLSLCQTCHAWASCVDRDDEKEVCDDHILRGDLSTDANVDAAENNGELGKLPIIDNSSHQKALDRCNSVKKAAQESIGLTPDEREKLNGRLEGE